MRVVRQDEFEQMDCKNRIMKIKKITLLISTVRYGKLEPIRFQKFHHVSSLKKILKTWWPKINNSNNNNFHLNLQIKRCRIKSIGNVLNSFPILFEHSIFRSKVYALTRPPNVNLPGVTNIEFSFVQKKKTKKKGKWNRNGDWNRDRNRNRNSTKTKSHCH